MTRLVDTKTASLKETDTDQEETDKPESPDREGGKAKKEPPGERLSPVMTGIRNEEEKSLRDWLSEIGTEGAFRIQLRRQKPQYVRDPRTGKDVMTAGFLDSYDTIIDEDQIRREHGGGTYYLKITRRGENNSQKYVKGMHRTVEIAGEPNLERLPSSVPPIGLGAAATVQPPAESTVMVKEAFGIMREQLDRAHDRKEPGPRGIDPAVQMLLEQLKVDARRRDDDLAELRRELSAARNHKPEVDPIKDKMLSNMLDGQSGHVEALRLRHESEIRTMKASQAEDERRLHDRHERDMQNQRASYEREITAMKGSHDLQLAAAKSSFELQVTLLNNDIRRLERDNASLRDDVKELRLKKDKTLIEQAKDLREIKDALSDGEESSEKTGFDKLFEIATTPASAEFVKGLFGKVESAPPAPAAVAARAVAVQPARPQMVKSADGQVFLQRSDGAGGTVLVPAKKKPKVIPAIVNADGTVASPAIELPEVDPKAIELLVGYLERAYDGKQDPEVVARSSRTSVPEEVMTWLRQNDTDQVSGVDLFMTKVAKLPSTSPLSTQGGRNWLRKVGKALVGE